MPDPSLWIQKDDALEVALALGSEPISIGRVKGNALVLQDGTVSREHAKIFQRDGRFHLVDLNSSHGSFVNGRRVTKHELEAGDEIRLGSTILRFGDAASVGALRAKEPAPRSVGPAPAAKAAAPAEVEEDAEFTLEMPDELLPAARPARREQPAATAAEPAPSAGLTAEGEDPFAEDDAQEAERLARFGRPAKSNAGGGGGSGSLYRAPAKEKVSAGPVWSNDLGQYSAGTRWLGILLVLVVVSGVGYAVMKVVQGLHSEESSAGPANDAPPPLPERRR